MFAELRDELAHTTGIVFAYAFGSALESRGFRDVDVAVWTDSDASPTIDLDLSNRLTRRLQLEVDVRRINDAPVSFLFHVFQGEPLLVRDDLLLANLLESTARRYHDLAPLLRRATREAFTG